MTLSLLRASVYTVYDDAIPLSLKTENPGFFCRLFMKVHYTRTLCPCNGIFSLSTTTHTLGESSLSFSKSRSVALRDDVSFVRSTYNSYVQSQAF